MLNLKRLAKSFIYSFRGLAKIFREEQNLRIQALAAILVIIISWLLEIRRLDWCILLIVIFTVVLMEIVNSAVERIADVLGPRLNNYIKEIKDITAAAVMLASLAAAVIGLIILGPYFIDLIIF
jgi:diacylglycerol kinase